MITLTIGTDMDFIQVAAKLNSMVLPNCKPVFLIGDDKSKLVESYAISILIGKGNTVLTTYPDSLVSDPLTILRAETYKVKICSMVLVASETPNNTINHVVATAKTSNVLVDYLYEQQLDYLGNFIRPVDILMTSDYDSDECLRILSAKCAEIAKLVQCVYETDKDGVIYYPYNLVKTAYDSVDWLRR